MQPSPWLACTHYSTVSTIAASSEGKITSLDYDTSTCLHTCIASPCIAFLVALVMLQLDESLPALAVWCLRPCAARADMKACHLYQPQHARLADPSGQAAVSPWPTQITKFSSQQVQHPGSSQKKGQLNTVSTLPRKPLPSGIVLTSWSQVREGMAAQYIKLYK